MRDYLTKDNLVKVTEDSDLFIKTYDEKLLKVESVEGYLNVLKLTDKVKAEFMTVEKFVSSHFWTKTQLQNQLKATMTWSADGH